MKKIFIAFFSILILFCNQILAQTNYPKIKDRNSYEMDRDKSIEKRYALLPEEYYPWGVCVQKPNFLGGYQISEEEEKWVDIAIAEWNNEYDNYKIRRWGDTDVVNIPQSPLFIKSCNTKKHNIVYILKENLHKDTIGRYTSVDCLLYLGHLCVWGDGRQFYGKIEMNTHWFRQSKHNFKKEKFFINVMIHELGHALGIPHLHPKDTEFMESHGFHPCSPTVRICKYTNYDWEAFLEFYGAWAAYSSRERAKEEEKRRREKEKRKRERYKKFKEECFEEFQSIPVVIFEGDLQRCAEEKERERARKEAEANALMMDICRPTRTDFGWTLCP